MDYLRGHRVAVDPNDAGMIDRLGLLDQDLAGKELFLCGEYHGTRENAELHFFFLRYFKTKADIKYYVGEFGVSHGYFLNKYIQTGDTKWLKLVFASACGSQAAFLQDYYDFWVKFRAFNAALPESRKITVVGVDIEHIYWLGVLHFCDLMPSSAPPESIRGNVATARELSGKILDILANCFADMKRKKNEMASLKIQAFAEATLAEMEANKPAYASWLGGKDPEARLALWNIVDRFKAYELADHGPVEENYRDECLERNCKEILETHPKGKMYGQMGLGHTILCPIRVSPSVTIKTFACRLNEDELSGKILSICYVYDHCLSLERTRAGKFQAVDNDSGWSELATVAEGGLTLMKRDVATPAPGDQLPELDEILCHGRQLDRTAPQYVVLIKNGHASSLITNLDLLKWDKAEFHKLLGGTE